jgi:beta-glucosidase
LIIGSVLVISIVTTTLANSRSNNLSVEQRIESLIAQMTLIEKIGQMSQVDAGDDDPVSQLGDPILAGRIGSILNSVDVAAVNEMQRLAVEESRLGIPLLIGRDVIHGFKTVMPIPIGQAATWNPDIVRAGARVAAREAAAAGVNWTFAPMIDITRDPRWGRIAESLGEDPYLAGRMGVAMVEGFQGEDLAATDTIAACAKHFAGYGESESGRDYATTNIPENELRNVHLEPFRATVEAGVVSLMTSFSDLDGIPASANEFLLREVLRDEWGFDGLVVSDWHSIPQLATHGLTNGDRDSALEAVTAGVDMEMASYTYIAHLADLVAEDRIDVDLIDSAVSNILRVKLRLGLFENPYVEPGRLSADDQEQSLRLAKQMALQSAVLLKNENDTLPLAKDELRSVAVIGPLAEAPYEQLGTWVFDGDPGLSVTGLQGIRDFVGNDVDVRYVRAMETSRSRTTDAFDEAVEAAAGADITILFLGEESILSGEAHSRANIDLPGAQVELVRRVAETGKPVIAVVMAGRPLTFADALDDIDALLFAWHPGSMAGEAIAELLFGVVSPSGKLPVSFPKMVGQIPIYYSRKNTGKPPTPDTVVLIDDIPERAPQTSLGNTAYHLDAGYAPLFEFGYGLSYATFAYDNLRLSTTELDIGESMTVSVDVTNRSNVSADEVVQLYVRDLVGNVTRPVRELKGFKRVHIGAGDTRTIDFELHTDNLAFYGRRNTRIVEAGDFHVWIGGSSETKLRGEFTVVDAS